MNYLKSYKSFINSQYLYEGIRTTSGILIPALLMAYFQQLHIGILLALGAMCVSITDGPGPILHRKNGMLACTVSIFFVTLIIGFTSSSNFLLGTAIFILCFFFSMLNIYGTRAGALGIASLLILVLNLENRLAGSAIVFNALYIASGGLWYMSFSILLYNVRPYKPVQQALGDCIQSIGAYLRLRAEFYRKGINFTDVFSQLLQQQAIVQDKQSMVSELLFKTRDIVKESTSTGRILLMIYMDLADMFERIMTSYQLYKTLHDYFDEVDILEEYRSLALMLANDIEEIGIAVKSGTASSPNNLIANRIKQTRDKLDKLRAGFMQPANMEGFINLRSILENIEDIYARMQSLHQYTTYDRSLTKKKIHQVDYGRFISHQDITAEMLVDNLTLQSENFRHSLRVSIAVLAGFAGSLLFPIGHSYWILLTIVVILKPAYSLSRSRNIDRLFGTGLGLLIGIGVLLVVHDNTVLLVLMIILMFGTFVFTRLHYFTSVILMTPYIIIFFHLLNPANFSNIIRDRLIDTAIGSVIAFAASSFLFPLWEREKIRPALINTLNQVVLYFSSITYKPGSFNDVLNNQQESRKNALVAMGNLSATFNRMLSEPRSKQKGIDDIHQFVVLCHMLISHLATLSLFTIHAAKYSQLQQVNRLAKALQDYIQSAVQIIEGLKINDNVPEVKEYLRTINEVANDLLEQRQEELKNGMVNTETRVKLLEVKSVTDQYNFIFNIANDLHKTARTLVNVV